MTITNRAGSARPPMSGAYRAVWRWHFYAGLLVLPVLCLMALTGGLYLFKDEIDAAVYRPYERIEAGQTMGLARPLDRRRLGGRRRPGGECAGSRSPRPRRAPHRPPPGRRRAHRLREPL